MGVVERGFHQQLEPDRRAAAIARQQGERRRQAAACALPRDGDAVRIDIEARGFRRQPAKRRVRVLDAGRKRMLRRQPVFDGDHQTSDLVREPLAPSLVHVTAPDTKGPAVDPEQPRQGRRAAVRPIEPHEKLRGADRTRNAPILDGHRRAARCRGAPSCCNRVEPGALLLHGRRASGIWQRRSCGDHGAQFRIESVFEVHVVHPWVDQAALRRLSLPSRMSCATSTCLGVQPSSRRDLGLRVRLDTPSTTRTTNLFQISMP